MDAKVFEKEKEKILKNATKYKALNRIKDMLDEKAKNPDVVNYGETDFDYNDQDVACADFGWPDVRITENCDPTINSTSFRICLLFPTSCIFLEL